MNRLEYKYLVPLEALSRLRQALFPFVEMDEYARNEAGEYTVHSVYFDTFSLDYYYQKEAGIQHRRKLRVRGYNEGERDSPVFLEIKRKNNMAISKNRIPVLFKHVRDLFVSGDVERYVGNGDGAPDAIGDARRFFYHVYRRSLRPAVLIRYEREAFFRKFNDSVRITFDKNLRSSPYPALEDLFREDGTSLSLPGRFILEVKLHEGIPSGAGIPSWLRAIMEDFKLERMSVSKYTICLDTHRMPRRSSKESSFALLKSCHFGS